jgi:hypothetical protein
MNTIDIICNNWNQQNQINQAAEPQNQADAKQILS